MEDRKFSTDRFPDTDTQEVETSKWQRRYYSLVNALGHLGTQIRVQRVLEHDRDIKPHNFIRGAEHEFIFPPQDVKVSRDVSEVIDPSPDYGLNLEDLTYQYDEELVKGHLQVIYDDSDSRVNLIIHDLLDESVIPADAMEAIEQVFATEPPNHNY